MTAILSAMRCLVFGIQVIICAVLFGQETNTVPIAIGHADTVLFSDGLHYTGYGYDGPAPLFLQAWLPVERSALCSAITFRELRERKLDGPLRRVYDELCLRMDSMFVEYDLRYPFDGDEPIDYTPYTAWQVKDSLFALPTHAQRASMPQGMHAPVIVYHHGAQGMSDENTWMAEWFAEHGFIFISCNWHWPLEGAMYGTPIVWEPDQHSIHQVLHVARQLANGNRVFYIGHSWGAQEGWCTLHEPGLVDAFISLETTMEWKTDTAEVRDKWPHVLDAITSNRYPMPILMVADTDGEPPFPMFRGVQGDVRYLDPKEPFGHESYTSAFLLRRAGDGRFNVPDAEAMDQQFDLHAAMLQELLAFLQEQAGMPITTPVHRKGDPFFRARTR